ncbi:MULTISPECIES: SDR family NAD(P)-dependent oxidoreductase [Streptomyces]|uniref:SDR family NAD(P)-dependent oxidoreductase n=1 Tax=Streptomyces TaxID=1883 RepID=UPI000F55848B|nr:MULTISPECIES: SDR family oxidoreductase [Streptomyces]RPK77715.1 4-formylbenzenesulfonate dehydrogenase TsaC1/TsaC2 [Streptomyces sp. ADI97-07]WUC28360.1 SDR family oxidoreductase [Streptomyces clavifer]
MSARIAVVAGAGGGLGRAVVSALRTANLRVVAIDHNEEALRVLGPEVHQIAADLSTPEGAKSALARVEAEVGAPSVLVNTIGVYTFGGVMTITPELLRQQVDLNVGAAIWLTQAVVPHMQQLGEGVIVHTAAEAGVEPTDGLTAYSVSKAATAHLTRVLDVELRPLGIRVNAVLPRLIATEANKAVLPPELLATASTPEAVAGAIALLVSEEAAAVHGALVPVNG